MMSPRWHREDVAVPSRRRLPAETPRGLREAFTEQSRRPFETSLAECLREGFVKPSRCLHEVFTQWARRGASAKGSRRLHERFTKTSRALKASRSLRESFAKASAIPTEASRRRHGRLHLEAIRQIMTSPQKISTPPRQKLFFLTIDNSLIVLLLFQTEIYTEYPSFSADNHIRLGNESNCPTPYAASALHLFCCIMEGITTKKR